MASKRHLKHHINDVCEVLFTQGLAVCVFCDTSDRPDLDGIVRSMANIQKDFLSRVSHPEPGMKPKVYYNKLKDDFHQQMREYVDQIVG